MSFNRKALGLSVIVTFIGHLQLFYEMMVLTIFVLCTAFHEFSGILFRLSLHILPYFI